MHAVPTSPFRQLESKNERTMKVKQLNVMEDGDHRRAPSFLKKTKSVDIEVEMVSTLSLSKLMYSLVALRSLSS